ncbi:low temperature requirement A [Catenulispora acidiphila DSM 44928]|uniref:Low temperature requirement A n=1 Tax=Catenulispora acidiphila (strain DSM 44928 / JCM 14897 / NBRC 102108 / NRRL B-24433 / ID139908) TaxID=479433 RepID=C7Q0N6_CATAD|nr:low temperature requirement protein A [Catenulispora acidiphila]ACU69664.1 low temperature requirement A [Catenulispora acidiphila DSM 44928]
MASTPVVLIRPILLRDPTEQGRTATTLELFFDLVFVVTISTIAQQWHHAVIDGHLEHGIISFVEMMFGVWWAWMGFTWFANFFDPDDVPYRLLVLVQLLASLGLASGIPYVFESDDFRIVVGCYVMIRLVMAAQWLRASHANPELRPFCNRWAYGILGVQVGWVVFGFGIRDLTPLQTIPFFILGALIELLVPAWAEAAEGAPLPHSEHVEERYGLFTIIILGEMVLVASEAFNTALSDHQHLATLMVGAISAGVLAFCLWWLYFGFLGEFDLTRVRITFVWGYGHYFIYGTLTAIGGTLAALLDQVARGGGALSHTVMALMLAVPVAGFLTAMALLRRVSEWSGASRWLVGAAAVLLVGTGAGAAWGAMWTLLSVCVATAAFLASEIVTKWKAAVRRRQNQGAA